MKLVCRLNRSSALEALSLAARLKQCSAEIPCLSGACPVCLRAFRKRLLREARTHFSGRSVVRVSWIPPHGNIPAGQLEGFDLRHLAASLLRSLQRALPPGSVAVGGIDFSLNVENNANAEWQAQGYALVAAPATGISGAEIVSALKMRLPLKRDARRPIQASVVDPTKSLRRILSYAMKAVFYRRSSYQYLRRSTGRPTWNTRAQALPPGSAVELNLLLDRFPIGNRLLLVGLRRVGPALKFDLRATARLSPPP
ncbi:MAG: hypothetical protein ACTHNH_12955 [Mesorhizobium sp.]